MTQIHPSQQEVYFDQLLDPSNPLYNIGTYVVIKGNLNVELFKNSILSSEEEFDVFKIKHFSKNAPKFDLLDSLRGIEITTLDYSSEDWSDEKVKDWLQNRINQPFNIHANPLYDFILLKRNEGEYWFYMGCHHLFSDGYGVPYVFLAYVFDKYHSLRVADEKEFNFPSYLDMIQKANDYLDSNSYEVDKAYWAERFQEFQKPILQNKLDSTASKTATNQLFFTAEEQNKLRTFCTDNEISLQDFLIAALAVYYNKIEGLQFFDFNVPSHNRTSRKERKALGLFTKLLPSRLKLENQSLKELFEQIKLNQRQDYRHKQFPVSHFSKMLVENENYSAPFNLQINFRYFRLATAETELELKGFKNDSTYANTPIEFSWCDFAENGNEDLFLEIIYREAYFAKTEIDLIGDRLKWIINQFYTALDLNIDAISVIPETEKECLLQTFNNTKVDYPLDKTVIDLFEEQVNQTPNSIAVIAEGKTLTYSEIDKKSNQLANYLLRHYNLQANDLVGLRLERNEWMIISILAVLKSGAAYVPIDPNYPQERINFIENDSQSKVCIDASYLNEFEANSTTYSTDGLDKNINPENLGYVIYTSGSTGIPKGVMIAHKNVYAFIKWSHDEFVNSAIDEVLFTTSFNFDLSVFEILYPLTTGKSLQVLENGLAIADHLNTTKKLLVNTVPSIVGSLLQNEIDFTSIAVLNMAGEPIPTAHKQKLKGKIKEIRNLYGPSEDTTYSTVFRVDKDDRDLIGRPISNTRVYVLNEKTELTPIGVVGEICMSGAGVTKGYLNQPDLTDEKYVVNPFEKNEILYKTGDLGKWLPDGNLKFLGRKDDQVKIRGYRIELGEIEHAVTQITSIEQVVVLAEESSNNDKELIAYITFKQQPKTQNAEDSMDATELKTNLKERLPEYMIPTRFIQLSEMPLTPNGKIDKKALSQTSRTELTSGTAYIAPINEIESTLVAIWEAVLEKKRIGVKDDFFSLGGHSIKAVRLGNAYRKKLGVNLSLKELFDHKTIAAHAKLIASAPKESINQIEAVAPQLNYPISFAQRRLWMLSQFEESSAAYNMPGSLKLEGKYDLALFQRAFDSLIERHEILRTVFKEDSNSSDEQDNLRQWIIKTDDFGFEIEYKDYRDEENNEANVQNYIDEDAYKTFDLENGPLLRASLLQTDDEKYVFYFNMHHIISDGWSIDVLSKEVFTFYNAFQTNVEPTINELRIQYKDFSIWQLSQIETEAYQAHKAFWLKSLSGDLSILNLPSIKQRPRIKTNNGAVLHAYLDADLTNKLKRYSKENSGSLFVGLMASWNVLMHLYTTEEDLVIGAPVAGRDLLELENQIGCYVNTLALRNRIKPTESFAKFFKQVKENTLNSYEHQLYPFDRLVEELELSRDISRSPVYDVILTLLNNGEQTQEIELSQNELDQIIDGGKSVSKLDISAVFEEVGEYLSIELTYNSDVYDKELSESLIKHFKQLLIAVLENPDVIISKIDYLSEEEKQQQLLAFNTNKEVGFEEVLLSATNDITVIDLFEQQVVANPTKVAVVFEGTELTYQELDEVSNRLANYLNSNCLLKSDDLIAIQQERSEWMMISILAVLKSGAAYVPIDPESPQERIDTIFSECQYKLLLDQKELSKFKKIQAEYSTIIEVSSIEGNQLAYVIFTSGSTGKPKGVMLEHKGLLNRMLWMKRDLAIGTNDVFLQKTPIYFDVSVWELFLPLISGSKLVFVKPDGHKDPTYIEEVINANQVSIIHFVPSMLASALAAITWNNVNTLRHVICSGEALAKKIETRFKENVPFAHLHNYYGPTEASIDVTAIDLTAFPTMGHEVSIGKPVDNTNIYIVNSDLKLQALGVLGEILIGGVQVARGYLNRKELTEEKFIESPFIQGERLYKTGDLGRWLVDGTIEFIGRKDHQVKIRGYRIELGEIEHALSKHLGVDNAIVLAKEDEDGEKELFACVVPDKNIAATVRNILKADQLALEFNAELYEMENGVSMYAYNRSEVQMLYTEVFEDRTYLKNGITIPENATIFDVGANVGSFSIFSMINFENAKVYAFEPLAPIYSLLEKNVGLYQGNVELFNIGISDKAEEAVFDYYPYATVLSGRHAENNDVKDTVRRFIGNTLASDEEGITDEQMEDLLNNRLLSKKYTCKLATLSQIIEENAIAHIDLLKVDVENAEMDIINGILAEDWQKIDQIIIEVHDVDQRLQQIEGILALNGFEVSVFQSDELEGTKLYNIYAIKQRELAGRKSVANVRDENWYGSNALIQNVQEKLGEILPNYMVPADIMLLTELPLTSNGKINRKALLELERKQSGKKMDFVAPRNELETECTAIWTRILQRENIGVKDDFFVLGGHSLKATKIITEYHKAFDVKLTLIDIFNHTTVASHSELIQSAKKEKFIQIEPIINQRSYALSDGQRRLWVLSQFEEGSVSYNLPGSIRLEGEFELDLLQKAFDHLIERHEILRTVFRENSNEADAYNEVRQWVLGKENLGFVLEQQDFRKEPNAENLVTAFINEDAYQPFNLESGPLFRATLLQLDDTSFVFYFNMHHIIGDGWSLDLLSKEVFALYEIFKEKQEPNLPELRIQYKDYAAWQLANVASKVFGEYKTYWLKSLAGELPLLNLPSANQRPIVKTSNGNKLSTYINSNVTAKLQNYTQENGGTLFMGLLATWNVLIYRYTAEKSTVVGTPIAGRDHADLQNQIGFYLNTLALKNELNPQEDFNAFYQRLKENTLQSYVHQMYPFDKLVEELELHRDTSRSAVFDVLFTVQNAGEHTAKLALNAQANEKNKNLNADEIVDSGSTKAKFDFEFSFLEVADRISLNVVYNSDVYELDTVKSLIQHYKQVLDALLNQPTEKIECLDFLSRAEKQQQLIVFNDKAVAYPKNNTLIELFTAQAKRVPNNVAIVFADKKLTYQELGEQSNQLAHYLNENYKIQPDDLVAIRQERSEWMLISILGVLKAGGAYVPIDPEYPAERISYIETDSDAKLCLDKNELNKFKAKQNSYAKSELAIATNENNLAYVIYTSGSTGKPKGVMVEHKAIVNTIYAQMAAFGITESNHGLEFASFSFDASISEAFIILMAGACLYIIGEDERKDPAALVHFINDNEIDIATLPPSYLSQIDLNAIKGLKKLITAGEAANVEKAVAYSEFGTYFNAYGPTETSICGTIYKLENPLALGTINLPIGTPISNVQTYLLNEAEQLQPIGTIGEICIAGAGLARGYLNQEELSLTKFIANPFKEGERLYKTGDLGRYLPDGNIEYIGRKDDQVKIRGYRIELGEIEQVLSAYSAVEAAIVVTVENQENEKELVAYFTANDSENVLSLVELRAYLEQNLPTPMIPAYFVALAEFPITTNGKIDKQALPHPKGLGIASGIEYIAARNEIEEKLVSIWQIALKRDKIGALDGFFALGGNSLKAMRLINEYQKVFNVKLSINDLFLYTSLEAHGNLIESANTVDFVQIPNVSDKNNEGYPVSDAQSRLWVLSQFDQGSVEYNMPSSTVLKGDYNLATFKKALEATIDRHEILRTVFKRNKLGEIRQWIVDTTDLKFEVAYEDFRGNTNKDELVQSYINEDAYNTFDLEKGPLLRVALLQVEAEEYVLYFNMHHIIGDGRSIEVLSKDVFAYCEALRQNQTAELPALRIQYKDYSAWQLAQLNGTEAIEHKTFWLNHLSGDLSPIELPSSKLRPLVKTNNGQGLVTSLDAEISDKLKKYTEKKGGTLFMGLLSVWNVLMYRYTGQKDIIVGTPIIGREHFELQDQIGFYVNMLALRNEVNPEESFNDFYQRLKENVLESYTHQQYPFDRLVGDLNPQRDTSRNAVFDMSISYHDTFDVAGIAEEKSKDEAIIVTRQSKSKFDIELHFHEQEEGLAFNLIFNEDVYDIEMIKDLMLHYKSILSALITSPEKSIAAIDYLSPAELEQQLVSFNATESEYEENSTIVELFEAQAKSNPDQVAIVFETKQLTYKELNEISNQLAHCLIEEYGIKNQDLVGIQLERSEWGIISMLAILKAGGAYVPIDSNYPVSRKEHIINDTNIKLLISEKSLITDTDFYKGALCAIADFDVSNYSTGSIATTTTAADLAYVIYTSGSTGTPKGVMVEQKAVIRLVKNTNFIQVATGNTVLGLSNFSFDGSTFDIFMPLLNGGKLVIAAEDILLDLPQLNEIIDTHAVDSFFITTVLFNSLVDAKLPALGQLKYLLFGGEQVSVGHVERFKAAYPNVSIHHVYGPTENTTYSTWYPIEKIETGALTIPIGAAIANSSAYILDENHQIIPQGAIGEICVGGDGLARGYLNQVELTEEKFITDPYQKGERIYKTGDLGKWLPDGSIEFIGRKDHQVKVRGYRIELGEIEHALLGITAIEAAVVMAKQRKSGEKELIAYLTAKESLNTVDLRIALRENLPEYMLPAHFVQLDEMPVNSNGKVAKKLLPDPEGLGLSSGIEYVAPRNEIEEHLLKIWKEILGKEKDTIGIDEGFFEAGGNSIKLIALKTRIEEELQTECTVASLFQYASVRLQADMILKVNSDGDENEAYELKESYRRNTGDTDTDIAVIGMSIKAPMSKNIHQFWENLRMGKELVKHFTDEELRAAGISDDELSQENYVKASSYLENKDCFDASFFGYLPDEAKLMDPQTRVFHEVVWSALEDAGYDPIDHKGLIGLYSGAGGNLAWKARTLLMKDIQIDELMAGRLRDKDFSNTLIAHKLNLKGSANSIQTACSTSLVAIHHAVMSLLSGENTMAIAGGVSIKNYPKEKGYLYQKGMILSKDGHNRTFDAEASGTVGAEGAGAVVLKKLSAAIKDGDQIHAVIKGSAINNDGNRKVGYTAPSVEGQSEVIQMAQIAANVSPDSISYIEAHGTATNLGDPIEVLALTQAFGKSETKYCAIGSVKSNMGHLDAAAGVAGFIKAALCLKHKVLVPSLHFKTPNPEIKFDQSPFYVNTDLKEWENNKGPLRAGVSSFGIGGTNAHVILEEPPIITLKAKSTKLELITMSAKTVPALARQQENLKSYLELNKDLSLIDIAWTLQNRRVFPVKASIIASTIEELIQDLDQGTAASAQSTALKLRNKKIAFMFSGQGAQYVNMGRGLYKDETSVFSKIMNECLALAAEYSNTDFKSILYPTELTEENPINETVNTQPILFMLEYALARQMEHFGIVPDLMIGHSIGEYAAACFSEVLTLDAALKLVIKRGELMQSLPKGHMLAVSLSPANIANYLSDSVDLAVVNTPESCVLSGEVEAIENLVNILEKDGIASRVLHTSHAFHSRMMDPILNAFTEIAAEVEIKNPKIPYISNVTGKVITASDLERKSYWSDHIRNEVKFSEGINEILAEDDMILIEVGPGNTLSNFARQHFTDNKTAELFQLIRHPKAKSEDQNFLLSKVSDLWKTGLKINWAQLQNGESKNKISLPTYAFEPVKYPLAGDVYKELSKGAFAKGNPKQEDISDWFYERSWKRSRLLPLNNEVPEAINYLVFSNDNLISNGLIDAIGEKENVNIVVVNPAEQFQQQDNKAYTLNPKESTEYVKLFEQLEATGALPDKIIHFWNQGNELKAIQEMTQASIMDDLELGYHSLLNIAKAIGTVSPFHKVNIDVITSAAVGVNSADVSIPSRTSILGPVLTIPKEHTTISCKQVDVNSTDKIAEVVSNLLGEINAGYGEAVIAYRSKDRWTQFHDPIKLESNKKLPTQLKNGGVYLITGGMGGMGLVFSKYLAQEYNAKLILTGRKPKNEISQTDLSKIGNEVIYIQADVSNAAEMELKLLEAEGIVGQINGVFHTAGIVDYGGIIQNRTKEQSEEVFAAKIFGTITLNDIVDKRGLNFLVLCSSAASFVAPFGQVAYTAANIFQDSFAESMHSTSVYSIAWDTWSETGMALTELSNESNSERSKHLKHGLTNTEGIEVLNRVLRYGIPSLAVFTRDLALLSNVEDATTIEEDSEPVILQSRPILASEYEAPNTEMEETMCGLFQDFFGIEKIGIKDDFFELGIDSLKAMTLINHVHQKLNVELRINEVMEHANIQDLAKKIDGLKKINQMQKDSTDMQFEHEIEI
ncbi:MAG: amino acid adenylation domain-containing protein/FkbM family methyltransferase [Crocinitomix sp.]|jgi:amino acid adenylation domain-containing protein/FkbM family methyltransferase